MKPVIKEGGTSSIFDKIKTLETPLQSSGTCKWVPEAKANLTTKNITENGVYVAKDDGAYGYSSVIVNVQTVGGITGTGSDGKQHTISTDPSGNVVDNVAPVEIRITAGPSYTGPFDVGEYISFDGLVVHAYDSDGADMGEVPFGELVFPVNTAEADGDMWTDGQGLNAMLISYTPTTTIYNKGTWQEHEKQYYVSVPLGTSADGLPAALGSLNSPGQMLITRYNDENYAASIAGTRDTLMFSQMDTTEVYGWYHTGTGGGAGNGVFKFFSLSQYITNIPLSSVNPTTVDPTDLLAAQTLQVQWSRPGDGLVLETSFGVSVVPGQSGNDN